MSSVFCVGNTNEFQITMFPVWQLAFTVPVSPADERRQILHQGLLGCSDELFYPRWDSPPTARITLFLCITNVETEKEAERRPESKRTALPSQILFVQMFSGSILALLPQ